MNAKIFGERFKAMREQLKHSQNRVCNEANISQTQITNFENGKFGSLDVLFALVGYYKQYFYLSNLFDERFMPLHKESGPEEIIAKHDIVGAKLDNMMQLLAESTADLKDFLSQK